MKIEIDNGIFEVDIEKTKQYYQTHSLCDCAGCRNYYAQVVKKLPCCKDFLSKFGVDIERPDEIGWIESENKTIYYLFVGYTVAGEILRKTKECLDIKENEKSYNIKIDNEYIPNEQKEKYFVITINNFYFPWELKERFPDY